MKITCVDPDSLLSIVPAIPKFVCDQVANLSWVAKYMVKSRELVMARNVEQTHPTGKWEIYHIDKLVFFELLDDAIKFKLMTD